MAISHSSPAPAAYGVGKENLPPPPLRPYLLQCQNSLVLTFRLKNINPVCPGPQISKDFPVMAGAGVCPWPNGTGKQALFFFEVCQVLSGPTTYIQLLTCNSQSKVLCYRMSLLQEKLGKPSSLQGVSCSLSQVFGMEHLIMEHSIMLIQNTKSQPHVA